MNINEFNIILGIVASLCTIGVAVAVTIRWIQDPTSFGPEMTRQRLIALTLAVMTGIVVIAVVISNVASAAISGTASTSTPGTSLAAATTTTDTSMTANTTTTAGPTTTADSTGTPAPFPTNTANYDSLISYGTATIDPNWRLDCGGCDEPVRVQVSSVATDAGNENMVWTFTFDNHTANDYDGVYFNGSLQLTDPTGVKHYATGPAVASPGASIHSGQSVKIQATFSFLPRHGGIYTLTGRFIISNGLFTLLIRDYGPQTITFP